MKEVILALVVGILIAAFILRAFLQKNTPLVLIVGGTGAGKTTLFHQLQDELGNQGTVPSMAKNVGKVLLRSREGRIQEVEIIDIPGHPRVRGEAQNYFSKVSRIVFMVDAVDFMTQKSSLAEHLFEVLSDPSLQKRKVPLLVACNKSDQGAKAHTVDFIQKRLEKELEAVRSTRASLGEGAVQGSGIAKDGEAFSFARLKGLMATFVSAAALTGEIDQIKAFLC